MSKLTKLIKTPKAFVMDSWVARLLSGDTPPGGSEERSPIPYLDSEISRRDYTEYWGANKELCDLEYACRKESVDSYPTHWNVSLAGQCELRCIMCNVSKDPDAFQNTMPPYVHENIRNLLPFVDSFNIYGAEPFFGFRTSEIYKLVEATKTFANIKFGTTTNAQLMDAEVAKFCLDNFSQLRVSIDSPDAETYESIRVNGTFERLMKNVACLRDMKMASGRAVDDAPVICVNYLVMTRTYKSIVRFLDLARELGVHEVRYAAIRVDPDSSLADEDVFVDIERTLAFSKLMDEAKQKAAQYGIKIIDRTVRSVSAARREANMSPLTGKGPKRKRLTTSQKPVCRKPWGEVEINQHGRVRFCHAGELVGNAKTASLMNIYNGDTARRIRREFLQGDYSSCDAAGCPSGIYKFGSDTGPLPEDGGAKHERLRRLPIYCEPKTNEDRRL